jgi:hypothetical protein
METSVRASCAAAQKPLSSSIGTFVVALPPFSCACVVALIARWTLNQKPHERREWRVRPTAIRHQPLLRRHQFSDSRFEYLLIALVGLCNRLVVFIGREPSNCRFTVLALANEQDIAYGQSWKLVRFLAGFAVVLL